MTDFTTDTHHGHPVWASAPRTPRTATDNPQVRATDTTTDTTDTHDHGHNWGVYIDPRGAGRSRPDAPNEPCACGHGPTRHYQNDRYCLVPRCRCMHYRRPPTGVLEGLGLSGLRITNAARATRSRRVPIARRSTR